MESKRISSPEFPRGFLFYSVDISVNLYFRSFW